MTLISPEELVAVIAALHVLGEREEPSRKADMPAWRRAMREESVVPFDE